MQGIVMKHLQLLGTLLLFTHVLYPQPPKAKEPTQQPDLTKCVDCQVLQARVELVEKCAAESKKVYENCITDYIKKINMLKKELESKETQTAEQIKSWQHTTIASTITVAIISPLIWEKYLKKIYHAYKRHHCKHQIYKDEKHTTNLTN